MKILAVIPARGGSKSIPRKNLVDINGKPLIAWTIGQAIKSELFDYIHVSTDSDEIANQAIIHGGNCEFLRPRDISGDVVGTGPALLDSIFALEKKGRKFDIIVELQPTYCFRGVQIIRDAVSMLIGAYSEVDSVITCKLISNTGHPDFAFQVEKNGLIKFGKKLPDHFARQGLNPYYACHGLVLASRTDAYKLNETFYSSNCIPLIVNDIFRNFDINEQLDLDIARMIAANNPLTFF